MASILKGKTRFKYWEVRLNYDRSYVYYTQIMQAETLATAFRLWKRNWKGKGREYTAGALVWQVSKFLSSQQGTP